MRFILRAEGKTGFLGKRTGVTQRVGIILICLGVTALSSLAESAVSRAERIEQAAQHQGRRRNIASQQRLSSNMTKFKDDNGVVTLTNRPDKYRAKGDYVELDIEKISIPKTYRSYKPRDYTSDSMASLISHYAKQYRLDDSLIYAVIRCESNFNPNAVSSAGACGLMQLMPATAAEMGVTNIYDPAQNIAGGAQYLSKMLGLFGNDLNLALAGYNAGPQAVRKHNGIPPYRETQQYVKNVLYHQRLYKAGGMRVRNDYLGKVRTAPPPPKTMPNSKKHYTVHFESGLEQPADKVLDEDPYYFIVYNKRTYPVRKELVARIEEPA